MKNKILAIIGILLLTLIVLGCSNKTTTASLVYSNVSPNNKVDIYMPIESDIVDDKPFNVVLFIHGGAWAYGSKSDYSLLSNSLTKYLFQNLDNCVYASMDYRLLTFTTESPSVYDMIDDITACISYIKTFIINKGYSV